MAKFSTRNLKVYLDDAAVISTLSHPVISAVTAAKPAVVTVADETGFTAGDLVQVKGTGIAALDGKYFTVGTINSVAHTIELLGSDNSGGSTVVAATAELQDLPQGRAFIPFCINTLSRDVPAGETISVATFCDPEASVAGAPQGAGTLSWGGPIDFSDAGFCAMHKALEDGKPRRIRVEFPDNIGSMIMDIEINSYSESFELNAAGSWTGGAVVKTKPQYIITEAGKCM